MNGSTLPSPFADFIVGVNYMPREHSCQMWSDWSEAHIKRDFKQIHKLGLDTVRTSLFWHAFQPLPDAISLEAVAKFDKLLESS
jgi:aryl-phospho-beta-D-glucosidase BglC (GH1 family)